MSYRIKWGDTLSALARRYGTTVRELAQANGIKNPDKIYAGRNLNITGGKSGGASGTPSSGGTSGTGGTGGSGRSSGSAGTGGAPAVDQIDAPAPGNVKGGVTVSQLRRIMPNLATSRAQQLLPHLNSAMVGAGITTKARQTAFLAQLAHESGGLRYFEEIASGAAYEGRRDLGNTQPGDGRRFKGRGPIQLTGRANYAAASKALGIDLVRNPERASDPSVGFKIATWFWNTRGLSKLADSGNFREITRRINGGYNGYLDRLNYLRRAQAAL